MTVDGEFQLLLEYPYAGPRIRRRVRSLAVSDWPYSIIYQVAANSIYVIAIAHQSRRSNYWRSRLHDNAREAK